MLTSNLVKRLTGLTLTTALLLNCFAHSIYPASLTSPADMNHASRRDNISAAVPATPPAFDQLNSYAASLLTVPDPTPTPESKIAFTSERDSNQEIYIMNPDGSAQTRLTNNSASDFDPTWSADGTKIAFISDRDGSGGTGVGEIYVMNPYGNGQTRLTYNNTYDFNPAWSPDGTKLAFVRYTIANYEFDYDIYVMDSDGSNQTRLTTAIGGDYDPTWSPDGTQIAFRSTRDGSSDIYVMDSDGSNQTNLTNNTRNNAGPAWSPDGTQIAFNSDIGAQSDIFLMDADGSNIARLSNDAAIDQNPAWSLDGAQVAYQSYTGTSYIFDI
ncbi:MAG TPA: hypothetical protein VGO96_16320, partial [Pyrinomonadaceae bacterium]|nr:hypothetical protein [Pyrinomonadaceae bacterium]